MSSTRLTSCLFVALATLLLAGPAVGSVPPGALRSAPQRSALQRPEDLLPAPPYLLTHTAYAALKRLVGHTPDSDPDKPALLLRLAGYGRTRALRAGSAARAMNAAIAGAGRIRRLALLRRQRALKTEARTWQQSALRHYLKIAREPRYASHQRMDEVLFNLASLLLRAGRLKQGRTFFTRMIRDYPQSKYVPDAFLAFADHYFDAGKFPEALKLYQQVAKYPAASIYGYAIYKQAWCWINLADHRRALEVFVRIIRSASRWTGVPAASRDRLVAEARRDAVLAYASVGMPAKAHPFFQRIGGQQALMMLEQLARIYADQGKFRDAASIYRRLMAQAPKSEALCDWQLGIYRATVASQGRRAQVIEIKRLAAVYKVLQRRAGASAKAAVACRGEVVKALLELSAALHEEIPKGAPALRTMAAQVDRELDALRK